MQPLGKFAFPKINNNNNHKPHVVRRGGDTRITTSPLTKSISIFLFVVCTIISSVSSSVSVIVSVSSTSPSTLL